MSSQSKEAKIVIAIEAFKRDPKLNIHKAATLYGVPEATLRHRLKGRTSKAETRPKVQLLSKLEEQVLIQHIIDLDDRGFSSRLKDIEDMANTILASCHGPPIGKL